MFHSDQNTIIHSCITRHHSHTHPQHRMVKGSESMADHSSTEFEFDRSLKELRGLNSQLQFAAEYCKTAFFNSQDKKKVLETTKEYVTRAVVTVVDHLGSISANLECRVSEGSSKEAQRRIESLTQRIGTCQLHSRNLGMGQLRWNSRFSRYHSRYMSSCASMTAAKSKEEKEDDEPKVKNPNSSFQFQMGNSQSNTKPSAMKWRLFKQKRRDVRAFISRRSKQIVASKPV